MGGGGKNGNICTLLNCLLDVSGMLWWQVGIWQHLSALCLLRHALDYGHLCSGFVIGLHFGRRRWGWLWVRTCQILPNLATYICTSRGVESSSVEYVHLSKTRDEIVTSYCERMQSSALHGLGSETVRAEIIG